MSYFVEQILWTHAFKQTSDQSISQLIQHLLEWLCILSHGMSTAPIPKEQGQNDQIGVLQFTIGHAKEREDRSNIISK